MIGNPPWGADFSNDELDYLRSKHKRVIERMIDSYIYFLDRAEQIVACNGYVGFIIPGTLLNQADARGARNLYLERGIANLINLGRGIFGSGVLNTSCILISGPLHAGGKLLHQDLSDMSAAKKAEALESNPRTVSYKTWQRLVERDAQRTLFVGNLTLPSLLVRLRTKHPVLKNIIEGEIQRGVTPDVVDAHVLEKKTAKDLGLESVLLRPSISGSQIKKFHPWRSDTVLIYTTRDTDLSKYPNVHGHLTQFKGQITCPEVRDGKHPWWALHRPRDPRIFESPKFIGLTTTTSVELIFDEGKGLFVTDAMYVFRTNQSVEPWALLGVMQSRAFHALYLIANQGEGRVIPQVKAAKLHDLPVPGHLIERPHKDLVNVVQRIEALNGILMKERGSNRVESLRRQIESGREKLESIVADLYGLTAIDRARIEEYLEDRA